MTLNLGTESRRLSFQNVNFGPCAYPKALKDVTVLHKKVSVSRRHFGKLSQSRARAQFHLLSARRAASRTKQGKKVSLPEMHFIQGVCLWVPARVNCTPGSLLRSYRRRAEGTVGSERTG